MAIIRKCKCIQCGSEFETKSAHAKVCSIKCKKEFNKEIRSKNLSESKLEGTENVEYIICKWCGKPVTRIYGIHINTYHPGKSAKDYRLEFPNSPIATQKDQKATHINSGKHMKEDKWREWASEKMKGDKNIMSKVNASEEKRKQSSHFSLEFYKKRYPDKTETEYKEMVSENVKVFLKDRLTWTQNEYWTKLGYSEDEAISIVANKQKRDLEFFINKYGEEKGIEKWNLKISRWSNNFKISNYSKVSQILFAELYKNIKTKYNEIYFATLNNNEIKDIGKNNEYRLRLLNRIILPDFFIKDSNKIIEFDGVYYHRNTPENNKREKERDEAIKIAGYKVFHVNEMKYYKNKDLVIQECLDFIEK